MARIPKMVMEDPFALVVPLLLLAATLLAGLIARRLLIGALKRWAARTDSHVGELLIEGLRGSILLWFAILGLHLATQNSEIPARYLRYIPSALALLWILSLTIAISRLAGNAVRFYGSHVSGAVDGEIRPVTSLTQKLAQLVVIILGSVTMLKLVFNINLTPVLATLGVGGLAVALALQDTLSNLFAGFYVSISGLVRIGDYIKLNTGEEGYIADINWRCTTMRGQSNNLVVIPNNKLGQAIFTNYFLPERRLGQLVAAAVAPESDIDGVEAILMDETLAATQAIPGLLAEPSPYILFISGPADAALVFEIHFNVSEFGDQYLVQSELRKRIWKRLRREKIAMPLPLRAVVVGS
jgi:small-conductance mechanosensitive channel